MTQAGKIGIYYVVLYSINTLVSRTGRAFDWCALQEALYKCIDTIQIIQYNTMADFCVGCSCCANYFADKIDV